MCVFQHMCLCTMWMPGAWGGQKVMHSTPELYPPRGTDDGDDGVRMILLLLFLLLLFLFLPPLPPTPSPPPLLPPPSPSPCPSSSSSSSSFSPSSSSSSFSLSSPLLFFLLPPPSPLLLLLLVFWDRVSLSISGCSGTHSVDFSVGLPCICEDLGSNLRINLRKEPIMTHTNIQHFRNSSKKVNEQCVVLVLSWYETGQRHQKEGKLRTSILH
jgi:hypothetical protein